MKRFLLLVTVFTQSVAYAQSVGFESFQIPIDSFDNGSSQSGIFTEDILSFQNSYDTSFGGFWDGFAISTMRNDTSAGISNQYSAIVGGGYMSDAYAVAYPPFSGPLEIVAAPYPDTRIIWNSIKVTNSAYAYYSMKEGDSFAKKFGGTSGDDPDYFRLHIVWNLDNTAMDTVVVDLADYTSTNNAEDFILDDWFEVDLSSWDTPSDDTSSISFYLTSSDTSFGFINTPSYFCIDDIKYSFLYSVDDDKENQHPFTVVSSSQKISVKAPSLARVEVFDLNGRVIVESDFEDSETINMSACPSGFYVVRVIDESHTDSFKVFLPN